MEIYKTLKQLRIDKGLTQKKFAEEINLSQQIISKIETNERAITDDILIAYSNYFKKSTDYLLGLKKDSFSPKEQEIEFVCNYTGLSKKSIEKIVNYKNHSEANTVPLFSSQLEPLNKMLETNDIDDLLMFISRYFYKKRKYGKQDASSIVNIYSILNQNSKPTEYELQAIELFNAQNLFSNMIERIGKEYEQKKG